MSIATFRKWDSYAGTRGMPVITLYNQGVLAHGHPLQEKVDEIVAAFDRDLSRFEFKDSQIYEMCFAKRQEEFFGAIAEKHGFVRVCLTTNPNTGNRIAVYVRTPTVDQ